MAPHPPLALPEGFTLGVATSSFQIEGAVAEDGRGPSIWDTFARTPGAVVGGDTGDVACDHYHRLEEDLDLLVWLGVDSYRFSIAWPRVQPDGRSLEPRGLDFYDRLVDGLLERGIHPLATLYHWDLPQRLEDDGGWSERATVERFVSYSEVVAGRLGDRVRDWSTLNEPWCAAFLGYDAGIHAPGVRDPARAIAAVHHLLLAHGEASRAIRAAGGPGTNVGIVLNPAPIRPASDDEADLAAARRADGLRNRVWLDPLVHGRYPDDVLAAWEPLTDLGALHRDDDLAAIAAPIDLLGINYYNPVVVTARPAGDGGLPGPGQDHLAEVPGPAPHTTLGWSIDATGLEELLLRLHRDYPGVTMAVTENGGAFPDAPGPNGRIDDTDRIAYLDAHLRAATRAAAAGVDVRGYYVWTLLDNFEWAEGYAPTFGIVHVDRATQVRTPKASADWYREAIAGRRGAAAS
ncbi:GH1 family beta-glucosidase [Nitriliruptor alkaliphilus]|uniref:GH1 family beta-glucosidase n=1 Tax=Nitriliruptor alkaliphilus TaxID=427918 RepID=UPI000696207A|nr:GH1 family beta-glucosidase [Nitriliruptor alkaliphilus]